MSRSKSDVIVFKHGLLWWLFIGWWWRPSFLLFVYILAVLAGYKRLSIEKRDNRLQICIKGKSRSLKWWILFGWWWSILVFCFCVLFGFVFKYEG